MVKFTSVYGPLVVIRRGANQPYFGKQSDKWAYSPQEQKRGDFKGFPVLTRTSEGETEPKMGVFSLPVHTPIMEAICSTSLTPALNLPSHSLAHSHVPLVL